MKNLPGKKALSAMAVTGMFACNSNKEELVAAPMIDKEQVKKEIQAKEVNLLPLIMPAQ